MTKNELYNALLDEGVNLPPVDKLKKSELEAMYAERHPEPAEQAPEQAQQEEAPETPQDTEIPPQDALEKQDAESAAAEEPETEPEAEAEPEPENIPPLHFSSAGWCAALNRSYFIGWHHPVTRAEYEALAPYADGAAK